MDEKIMVSLIIEDVSGNIQKLQMRDSKGELHEEVVLPILDYMLSSYKSLERYFEEALKNKWLSSSDVKVKIVSTDGIEYELPFGKNVETIFRCSESTIYKGGKRYIEKGTEPQMVSSKEFEDFFNEFLYATLSEEGTKLVEQGHFKKYYGFEHILKEYQQLNQKEDDMYAQSRINCLEKGFSSCRNPKTIEDFLRDYYIFRDSLKFISECDKLKKQKKENKNSKIKGQIIPEKKKGLVEKHKASYYKGKRSLCFIIGNNATPLIIRTDFPKELDDYVVQNFQNSKDIKRAYKDEITEYIKQNKEYVKQIRTLIGNEKYNGQLAILEHNDDGSFKRLTGGQYFRFPVIYTSTFNNISKLYCNIDLLRKKALEAEKNVIRKNNEITVKTAEYEFTGLQDKLADVVSKLEEEKRISADEKQKALEDMKQIIEDMKDLEQADYNIAKGSDLRLRMFSNKVISQIRYTTATRIKRSYKMALDEWAKSIQKSDYKYDHIRFILRQLRKKGNYKMENKENREIEISDQVSGINIIEMNKEYILPENQDDTYETSSLEEKGNHKK